MKFTSFRKAQQRGQGMSEYIIIVAMVAVGAIAVFTNFGGVIRNQVAGMAAELAGDDGTAGMTAAKAAATKATAAATKTINMGSYAGQNTQ